MRRLTRNSATGDDHLTGIEQGVEVLAHAIGVVGGGAIGA